MTNQDDSWKNEPVQSDSEWAKDVPFLTLEDKIDEKTKFSRDAFRPLSSTETDSEVKNNEPKKPKKKVKGRKSFIIFLTVWLAVLSLAIGGFLFYFYRFLEDYEIVYQESLPYHVMDSFMSIFEEDTSHIYHAINDKPDISRYESDENVIGYIETLLEDKTFEYSEASESSDKAPVYNITADGYIIGKVTMYQSTYKRPHDLPVYEIGNFEFYTDPGWSVSVKVPETCTVYINDTQISPENVIKIDVAKESHFEGFTTLPVMKTYKVSDLYEEPTIKVISAYDEELTPVLNNKTGVYEVPYSVSKETEEEMIEFAKSAVKSYTQVICREVGNQTLYSIFTKDNEICKSIILNDSSFKWFPNHTTTEVEDEIIEFIPYTEDAFYCEIKHTQHMLIYGVRPHDEITDTRFYYVKENGNWKICHISF